MVVESPARELMRALLSLSGANIGTADSVVALATIADSHFSNWTINVLDCHHVAIVLGDDLSRDEIDQFCDQVVAELSASCSGVVYNP